MPDEVAADSVVVDLEPRGEATDAIRLRLAATHAALDPARRRYRRSTILLAALDALASTSEGMTSEQVTESMRGTWGTQALHQAAVDDALQAAQAANLVELRSDAGQVPRWVATAATLKDAKDDAAWVDRILDEFTDDLADRLAEIVEVNPERIPRLASHLLTALAQGTASVLDAAMSVRRGDLLPVSFDLEQVARHLERQIEPKHVAKAMLDVASVAVDPDDPFGNEVVRLLVIGSILYGLVTQQGVTPVRRTGATYRVLLDTSCLVYMLVPDSPECRTFHRMVEGTISAGGEVVVPEHVLEEWDRVWEAASSEMDSRSNDERDLVAQGQLPMRNPAIQGFVDCHAQNRDLNWYRYVAKARDIRSALDRIGVVVRPSHNKDHDGELAASISSVLLKKKFRDSQKKADTDGASCAMVARWRREQAEDPPAAWFVASDTLTGRAYKELCPDDPYPLQVTPESWLLFLAVTAADDAELVDRAATVGEIAVKHSFLSVATAFSTEEALTILDVLQDSATDLDPAEVRRAIGDDLTRFLHGSPPGERAIDALDIAKTIARNRNRRQESLQHRRDREYRRRTHEHQEMLARLEEAEAETKSREQELAQVTRSYEERLKQQEEETREQLRRVEEQQQAKDETRTRRRHVGVAVIAVVAGWIGWSLFGTPGLIGHSAAVVALVVVAIQGRTFIDQLDTPRSDFYWRLFKWLSVEALLFLLASLR